MKIRNLILAAGAALAALTACNEEKPLLGISVDQMELSFDEAGGTSVVKVTIDGDGEWNATVPADAQGWVSVTGNGSAATVKVLENTGTPRSTVIKFAALYYSEYVTVSQAGPVAAGDGLTYETAFSASEMVAYIKANVASGAEAGPFYVKGVIAEVKTTFAASGTYGNAVFYMSDNGDRTGDDFYVFQTYYLGNRQWKSGDTDIQVGDKVVICGKVTNYSGNTPETVGKGGSFIYELNGVSDGGNAGGSEEDPSTVEQLTCAEFIAKADPNTTYRLVGKVTSSVNTAYCSFDMSDGTGTVVVWTVNNKDEWKDVVKKDGTVTVRGKYLAYGSGASIKHEVVDAYIEKFEEGSVAPGEAKGSGTLEDPYNPAGAAAYAQSLGNDVQSPSSVYIKGKISNVRTSFSASGNFGNANFDIVDSETSTGSFYIFQTYYLGNRKWETGDTDVQVGDEVIVCGPVVNYQGNTPETAGKGASYIYSLNGQTQAGPATPTFGVASTAVSVSASATSATVKVTGNVAWSASGRGVAVSPASGEGAGDITVSFDPNTDTENARTYTVVVSTTAEVATQSYTVTITQAKASSGNSGSAVTISIDFTDVSARPDGFPAASSAAATSGTWTLSGYSFSFSASNAYYWVSNNYGTYLMLGKQDSYMLTPAIEGKSLTSVKFLTGANASEYVIVDICTASGTSLGVNSEKLKKGTTYEWTVSGAPAGEGCQIKVTNGYNAQFQNLELVYE